MMLKLLSADYDLSCEFGAAGGHSLLKKLLLADTMPVTELIEDIVAAVTLSGCVFPSKAMITDDVRELTTIPVVHTFYEGINGQCFNTFLRKVPRRMHGVGQAAVGYVLWNSAIVLSRLLVHNRDLLKDKTVLEMGAGVGLCGIVAARYAKEVCLSDFSDELCMNMKVNVGFNSGGELINGEGGTISPSCRCEVRHLDWNNYPVPSSSSLSSCSTGSGSDGKVFEPPHATAFESVELNKYYDIVIGSDVVCCAEDAEGVSRATLSHVHSNNGLLVIVIPQPQHRYGTEHVVPVLVREGFEVYSRPVAHTHCTSPAVANTTKSWVCSSLSSPSSSWEGFVGSLVVDDDRLVEGTEERDYVAWNLIVARKSPLC